MFDRLAAFAERRRRLIVIGAVIFSIFAGAIGGGVAELLEGYGADDPDTESVIANERLEDAGYRGIGAIVLIADLDVRTRPGAERVGQLTRSIAEQPGVETVQGFLDTDSPAFVSDDGDATYLAVRFASADEGEREDAAEGMAESLSGEDDVIVGGAALAGIQVGEQVEGDLARAELLAFPILFLLSLLFFRSLVAALLPLLVGGLAIICTFLILRTAVEFTPVSIFALNLVTGLGLGLAIDYSLFIVSRYREELARVGPGLEALRRTLATAGRTVLFSSLTVAGALASLVVFPQNFLLSMGLGGAAVALVAAAISLIVLPAILAMLGTRVNALAPRFLQQRAELEAKPTQSGFWYRLSHLVMRIPVRVAAASSILLIVLGIPFLGIEFTSVDAQVLPESKSARQVDDTLRAEFPPFRDSPVNVVYRGEESGAGAIADEVAELPGVAEVEPPRGFDGGVFAINAISETDTLSEQSQALVERIREIPEVEVTGATAEFIDLQDSLAAHLPIVLVIVVGVTFLVLFLMTGSVVLPLKQVLMNALGLSATFGILVLIFQDGRFEGLLDYDSQGGLEATQPLLLFAVAFGLSTDYGVFLLARIKEARGGGEDDREAIATGVERSGRIITAAALLFSIAIGAFVTSEIIFIKQVGLGTAIAVLIDATIIRALLVPSLMRLLGHWNWWAPAPLRRLHDRIGLSES